MEKLLLVHFTHFINFSSVCVVYFKIGVMVEFPRGGINKNRGGSTISSNKLLLLGFEACII